MAGTFEALAVIAVAVLPGGAYVWAFERQVGGWGSGLADRLLRLIGVSAAIHAVAAPISYWVWASVVQPGRLVRAEPLSWALWLVPIAFVGLPWCIGTLMGQWWRDGSAFGRPFRRLFRVRSPRAWDHLFATELHGYVRLRLKTGGWLGGVYAAGLPGAPLSHASRYPEAGDLWLARQLELDEHGYLLSDDIGSPMLKDHGVLIRWDEVEFLEFSPAERGNADARAA